MHLDLCTNTHRDVTDLGNDGMVKNAKTWISWERNIIFLFLWNKKIHNLCFRWHILRSYHVVVEVPFKNSFICFRNKVLYPSRWYLIIKKKDWFITLRGVYMEDYIYVILALFLRVYWKRIFKNQHIGFLFLFIFLSRWINWNKFKLIHLHKNMKSTQALSFNVMSKVTRVSYIVNVVS